MKEWYHLKGVDSVGPLEPDEISKLIQNDEIDRNTLIWKQGMIEWQKACESSFASNFCSPPPPPASKVISNTAKNTLNYMSSNVPNRKCSKCDGILKYTSYSSGTYGFFKTMEYVCSKCKKTTSFDSFATTAFFIVFCGFMTLLLIADIVKDGFSAGSFLLLLFIVGSAFLVINEVMKLFNHPIISHKHL